MRGGVLIRGCSGRATRLALDSLRAVLGLLALLALGASVSCIEVPPPRAKDALVLKDVKVSEGGGLETACVPTAFEVCFDALDNNCNGVIDEGCGLHTGVLQFVIAWQEAEADVDLNVYDTSGELARVGEPTMGGLMKDRDCPRQNGECQGQNVENVFLAEGEAKRGRYRAVVRLDKLNGATAPVKVRLGVRVGQRSYGMGLALSPGAGTEEIELAFSL